MNDIAQQDLLDAIEQGKLGETEGDLQLDSAALNRAAVLSLASQASQRLYITSRYLDAMLYDNAEFVEAVSKLARNNRFSIIRILINDPEPAIKQGHRLVSLGRRLSSSIEIRRFGDEFRNYNEAFLVADTYGVMHRKNADLYESSLSFKAPLKVRELIKAFDVMWKHSIQDSDLRRLDL